MTLFSGQGIPFYRFLFVFGYSLPLGVKESKQELGPRTSLICLFKQTKDLRIIDR